jgi:C_GCAxxG_C_C family probable redox protein
MIITQEQKEMAVKLANENQMEHGMSCSESVFNALICSKILDIPEDYTRIATGLSGGVAASGNTCGAIYGGLLALGWIYGRKNPFESPKAPDPSQQEAFEKDYRFNMLRRFNCFVHDMETQIGTTKCWDIVKGTGGYFNDNRVMKCPDIIVAATETLIKYLELNDEENLKLEFGYNILGFK